MGSSSLLTWSSLGLPLLGEGPVTRLDCFSYQKECQNGVESGALSLIWAIWKERNKVVFEDEIFSPNRLKTSFISALIF